MALRPVLVLWHRWFGLIAAVWLLLLALTGSFIVFMDEADRALNPDLRRVEATGEPLPVQALVDAVATARPGTFVDYLLMPTNPTDSVLVFNAPVLTPGRPTPDHEFRQIYLNPYTAQILGDRRFGEPGFDARRFSQFMYQLHMDLNLGPVATWLLGLLALLWVFDHVASAMLSFPTARRWMESFRVRWKSGSAKITFDLHRAPGLWLFPVTLMLAVTGVALNWPTETDAVFEAVSPTTPFPTETLPTLPQAEYRPAISIDRAMAIARAETAGARVSAVSTHPDKGVYWVRLKDPRDLDETGGRWVVVDFRDGRVLSNRHLRDGSVGDEVKAWLFPLHTGHAVGWPGRILICLSGLVLSGFIVTGVMIWWTRRSAKLRTARRTLLTTSPHPADVRGQDWLESRDRAGPGGTRRDKTPME
jgi:uncharacterized iron-regulated membrane protein